LTRALWLPPNRVSLSGAIRIGSGREIRARYHPAFPKPFARPGLEGIWAPRPGIGGQPAEPSAPGHGGSVSGSGVIFAGARPGIPASPGLWVRGCLRLLVPFNAFVPADAVSVFAGNR